MQKRHTIIIKWYGNNLVVPCYSSTWEKLSGLKPQIILEKMQKET
jgi:hypothetical protein